jgi:hypothetical protein
MENLDTDVLIEMAGFGLQNSSDEEALEEGIRDVNEREITVRKVIINMDDQEKDNN